MKVKSSFIIDGFKAAHMATRNFLPILTITSFPESRVCGFKSNDLGARDCG